MKNDRLLKALLRQPVDTTPVWMMRQAGRYLPEFRKLRAKEPNFMRFCKIPELACEVTLQPLERFDFDAAIIFSDILTVVEALGFDLEFVAGVGPVVHNPVKTRQDVPNISADLVVEKLQYVFDALQLTRRTLNDRVPLIGFAGSPFTVACYMVEGQNQKQFQKIRSMVYAAPEVLTQLLAVLTEVTIHYLNQQIAAGAQVIMLFDSWGGILAPDTYLEFSLKYMREIAKRLPSHVNGQRIPVVFFTKNGGLWLEQTAAEACDAVGLDWTMDIGQARQRVGDKVALQGNLDPMALYGTPESVRRRVREIIANYGGGTGHVFNLGHGIDKDTPIENVQAMVSAVRETQSEEVV